MIAIRIAHSKLQKNSRHFSPSWPRQGARPLRVPVAISDLSMAELVSEGAHCIEVETLDDEILDTEQGAQDIAGLDHSGSDFKTFEA